MDDTIDFAVYLTGHDKDTINQMYNDWIKNTKENESKNY